MFITPNANNADNIDLYIWDLFFVISTSKRVF
ncbi:Uncharacterised protein [Streptococcus pyogenes]|nr:hypothetical protein Z492_01018 [Streptococcus pyogenes ABC020052558]EZK62175.1 hypothetical protein Z486_01113 [Streptococcus pyogenes ABC020048541]EZK67381.1 hypothetical protein Z484_00092 [Streptococcus pyogenes ABC020047959]EZK69158.1 hypothetical protein Z482_01017 [Streptococcus pyogenes ABC020047395]EZK70987.1 hypothetical protein Z475_00388 [Streptococcus pyogenes ABC020044010]EZK72524.1 hypothetical protein Z477_00654 [Streptococcus pyogenes ABC020044412]EZK80209.1 hypothetical p